MLRGGGSVPPPEPPINAYLLIFPIYRTFLPSYPKIDTHQFDIYAYVDTVLGGNFFGHGERFVGCSPHGGGSGAERPEAREFSKFFIKNQ